MSELTDKIEAAQLKAAEEWIAERLRAVDLTLTPLTADEIDEAVTRIMEHAGVAERGSGWEWRALRDYSHEVEQIIRAMLAAARRTPAHAA